MKRIFTIALVAFLIVTMLASAVAYAQDQGNYKGYYFKQETTEETKTNLKEVIDNIITKKAELYVLDKEAQEIKDKADELANEGRNQEAGELYNQYNFMLNNKILPLEWQIEDLKNLDDYSFVMYIKNIDFKLEQEEIQKLINSKNS